jgi:hypothetical protein
MLFPTAGNIVRPPQPRKMACSDVPSQASVLAPVQAFGPILFQKAREPAEGRSVARQ